jgi:endonuclease/exonuclease/phosphatase family metal-dependent hydrolase
MSAITLATWNLWWRFGDAERRRPAIGTVLQRAQPDIVGLQEVWQHDQLHLAGELAAELGFHTAFAAAEDSSKWQAMGHGEFTVGNAILSRWPFESSEVVELPAGEKPNESRFALSAVILTPHGSMRFTTTHLNSGLSHNNIRAEQLRHLVGWLAEQPAADLPMVVTGDLNAGPDFDEVRPLTGRAAPYDDRLAFIDSWEYANPEDPGFTWDRHNPNVTGQEASYRIDYVLVETPGVDGVGRVRTTERFAVQPIEGVVASDHYGVIVEIEGGSAGDAV